MSNLLRDIFSDSDKDIKREGTIQFPNPEKKSELIEALETVYNEGKTVRLDGEALVSERIKIGDKVYPLIEQETANGMTVGPVPTPLSIDVHTEKGDQKVDLDVLRKESEIILSWGERKVIYFKAIFNKNTSQFTISSRMQLKYAKSIEDVSNDLQIVIGIFSALQKAFSLNKEQFHQYIDSFLALSIYIDQMVKLQETLGTAFPISEYDDSIDSRMAVHELYLLLVEKVPVRLNKTIKSIMPEEIELNGNEKIGDPIELTYSGHAAYSISKVDIRVYTAVLIINAVIKDIQKDEDGETRLLYGDTDSNPMYISFKGYTKKEDAQEEIKKVPLHKEEYIAAETVKDHVSQWIKQREDQLG